jgi:hypothetical protein
MFVKPVTFDHNGQLIYAQILYELNDITKSVTVYFPHTIVGVNKPILFVNKNGEWITASNIKKLYPVTTQHIVNCLKNIFDSNPNSSHDLAVRGFLF